VVAQALLSLRLKMNIVITGAFITELAAVGSAGAPVVRDAKDRTPSAEQKEKIKYLIAAHQARGTAPVQREELGPCGDKNRKARYLVASLSSSACTRVK